MVIAEPTVKEIRQTRLMGRLLSPLYKKFAERIQFKGNEKVIDFGSGAGNLARHLAPALMKKGGELTCVDISHLWQEAIRKELKKFPNVKFGEGAIQSLSLKEK
jgi:ubiquinone/menaquinone biosynthesis C-methylase UbiE